MLTYSQLRQRPSSFKSLTGITVAEFEALYARFEPAWQASEVKRLMRADRQRAVGAGKPYALELRTRLVMLLVWLRLYLTTEALGCLFELHKSNVSRNGRRLLTVLR